MPTVWYGAGAARQAVGAFEARDAGFDTGAEVAELPIDPLASDHVPPEAGFLVEGHAEDAPRVRCGQIVARGEPPSAAACRGAWP